MKRAFTLALALSALTTASAFAVPKAPEAVAHSVAAPAVVAQANPANAQPSVAEKAVLVADNRKEFGSQYQRY